jgi:glycosyltransferase involved in cell wall biosynthesis
MPKVILAANTDWYLYNFRRSLAFYLREQGFEVILVSPPGNYISSLEQDGFRWISWQVGRQTIAPWQELPAFISLVKIYRCESPDLVHHHTIKPVLYGSLAARLAGLHSIVNSITGRGYVFLGKGFKARLLKPVARWFYRLAFNQPDQAAIFENEEDRQYFITESIISAENTRLIAGVGVDTQRFFPTPEPSGPPLVLLASRMLWDKGVGILVEAARLLQNTVPHRIVLVGAPDPGNPASIPEDQLRAWESEGLIEWWGWQSDMVSAYQQCAVATLPTMYGEGVPTALLEAAACGRPLVASDMPGCRAVVIDQVNGYLVPPNDPGALAQALDKLLADPALRGRMGAASRQHISEQFRVERVNQDTLGVYQHLLAQTPLPGRAS